MEMSLASLPKAENILIHTGNIVNWNRLKGTVAKSATNELSECIKSTIESWLQDTDADKLQYVTEVQCLNTKFLETLKSEERLELKLTVKIFVSGQDSGSIADAVNKVISELDSTFIETVILSVPDEQRTMEYVQPLWSALEEQVTAEKVYSLGISDLNKDLLEELYHWAQVKPSINQVNLTTCCVIPPELAEFAKEHDIQLLTHNDPPVILSDTDFQELLSTTFKNSSDGSLWQPTWVTRYSVLIKCRGVIKSKGYMLRAERDVRKLPYTPNSTLVMLSSA